MSAIITLSTKYLRVVVYVKIMKETIWLFGYQCSLGNIGGDRRAGDVTVPRWHPIRSAELGDCPVLVRCDSCVVYTPGFQLYYATSMEVCDIAFALRCMQQEWDQLTPYEREYRVW